MQTLPTICRLGPRSITRTVPSKTISLRKILQLCTEVLVTHLHAAIVRIWTLSEAENVLELQASSGIHTHLDGPYARVPVGHFIIGLIAAERKPHLTNSVVGDPLVHNQEWAKREGMVAFAGFPLLVEDRVVGVIGLFARHSLSEEMLVALGSVADGIALGISHKRIDDALRASDAEFRVLAEAIPQILWITRPDGWHTHFNQRWMDYTGLTLEDSLDTVGCSHFTQMNNPSLRSDGSSRMTPGRPTKSNTGCAARTATIASSSGCRRKTGSSRGHRQRHHRTETGRSRIAANPR